MATVVAIESFVGVLEKDVLAPSRIEHHSEFPNQPSVIPGKVTKQGRSVKVVKGQAFEDSHPAVKKWPQMFGKPESTHPVEQATAAPGERRAR
jgi:hypothetical protein